MASLNIAFRPLFLGCALFAVPLLCGAKGTGCGGSDTIPIGSDGGGGSGGSPNGGTCPSAQCGPALGLPNYTCPDGKTIAGPTGKCLSTPNGCRWEVIECPPNAGLKWFTTCGDPVCRMPDPDDPNVPNCTTEAVGAVCSTPGVTCEVPGDSCGANLICAAEDPKSGSCPISLASEKYGIEYVPPADLQRLHDDLLGMRMAHWHYRTESSQTREHLGFIIDDQPNSPAVAANGQQVDLYGYTSMAVAAVQVQARQIEALEREVRALATKVDACRRGEPRGALKDGDPIKPASSASPSGS